MEPLPLEALDRPTDPALFPFADARSAPPPPELVGQARAKAAVERALLARGSRHHLYVSGPRGTGRTTYILSRLRHAVATLPPPPDVVTVPGPPAGVRTPHFVRVPAGEGPRLVEALALLGREVANRWPDLLAQAPPAAPGEALATALEGLRRLARAKGLAVSLTAAGLALAPLGPDGTPLPADALGPEVRARAEAAARELEGPIQAFLAERRRLERQAAATSAAALAKAAESLLAPAFAELKAAFPGCEGVAAHADRLWRALLQRLRLGAEETDSEDLFAAAVLVHRSDGQAPLVYEPEPTLANLLGTVASVPGREPELQDVQAGAFAKAAGGFLVLPAERLTAEAYGALVQTLRHGFVRPLRQSPGQGAIPVDPEPLPVRLRVVLIGPAELYARLRYGDPDFAALFGAKAEFDDSMARTPENEAALGSLLCHLALREGLLPPTGPAVASLVAAAARRAESQRRLSCRIGDLLDLLAEADVSARRRGGDTITPEDVADGANWLRHRSGLVEEHLRELLASGRIRIEITGKAVGQANGLTVVTVGDSRFGLPTRVSARTWVGRAGVVDVDRETMMSGPIHTKGVLIASGFLGATFGRDVPLALSASVTFEQTYQPVDGDSASSTELYALLSDLSGLPIAQRFAITGSVDQHGRIQPIGGVNEKIEGFHALVAARGFPEPAAVLIPWDNKDDLMLADDVRQSVAAGRFAVYAVRTVAEGIELLTGVPAGSPDEPGTVFGLAAQRLRQMAAALDDHR